MLRKILCLLLIAASVSVFLLLPLKSGRSHAAQPAEDKTTASGSFVVDLLSSSELGLNFRLQSGEISVNAEGQMTALGLEGRTQEPGAPSLPFYSTFIVLPPGANVEVAVNRPNWISSGEIEIKPTKRNEFPGLSLSENTEVPPVSESSLIDRQTQTANEQDSYYPQDLFEISEPMYMRDIRFVKLSIYPIRFNPIQQEALIADEIVVDVRFASSGSIDADRASSYRDIHGITLSGLAINWERVKEWRGLPEGGQLLSRQLPIGVDVYKIALNSDDIFKIQYSDLQSAGMDVDNVDPSTFEMLYRGESVSYLFIGNDDTIFQPDEYLYFYGWEFDGPRLEKQFITDNIFWLWAGGTPSRIEEISSVSGTQVEDFGSTITREPENLWFASWTNQWEYFPNEPDAWYWERYTKGSAPLTKTYEITLPNPAEVGEDAILTAEFSSKPNPLPGGEPTPHVVHVSIDDSDIGTTQWYGKQHVNVTTTIPITGLNNGINQIEVVLATNASVGTGTAVYLNRLTVEYRRELVAVDDHLTFGSSISGTKQFSVKGFNTGLLSDILIWDISDKLSPRSILSDSISLSGSGPYTYTFGTDHVLGTDFIATTLSNVQSPINIERVVLENLDAQPFGADWIAISHRDFITEVERLAEHRSTTSFGSMTTHVVPVDSVIDQFGYGLPLPSAIRDYLFQALMTWELPPSYVTLVGDSTINPRNNLNFGNPLYAPQLVPTDLAFVDRFQGQIPSDHVFSMLIGRDLIPVIAIGRIPVKTVEVLGSVIDKIIIYEQNQLLPSNWMENILFLADDFDSSAGDFCLENQIVGSHLPDTFSQLELCRPTNPTITDTSILRSQFFTYTNHVGVSIVNYRGHGGRNWWGGYPEPILSTSHTDDWENPSKPVVILTGDCLDGFFAYPGVESLAETKLRANDRASAAHWSSSGLGFSVEHSMMVEGFYDGLFLSGQTAVGDAANYAKIEYFNNGGNDSIIYSFILEGDPAMQMMRPALSIDKSTATSVARKGDLIDFHLDIANVGVYPSHIVVTDSLPLGTNFITATSSVPFELHSAGSDIVFDLQFEEEDRNQGMPKDSTVSITITVQVDQSNGGGAFTNLALVDGTGVEAWPGDESDSVSFYVLHEILLPRLIR